MKKKIEREQREKTEKQELVKDTHLILDWQQMQTQNVKDSEIVAQERERGMLN